MYNKNNTNEQGFFKKNLIKRELPIAVISATIISSMFITCLKKDSVASTNGNSKLSFSEESGISLGSSEESRANVRELKYDGEFWTDGALKFCIAEDSTAIVVGVVDEESLSGELIIPGKVVVDGKEYSVTSIGRLAFEVCTSLTSIEIPSSVKSIGERAFGVCTSLTSIEIPSSVKSIGDGAFEGCKSLEGITIPKSVESIGNHAFRGCERLDVITIPSSVESIGEQAFNRCERLKKITIPADKKLVDHLDEEWTVKRLLEKKYESPKLRLVDNKN